MAGSATRQKRPVGSLHTREKTPGVAAHETLAPACLPLRLESWFSRTRESGWKGEPLFRQGSRGARRCSPYNPNSATRWSSDPVTPIVLTAEMFRAGAGAEPDKRQAAHVQRSTLRAASLSARRVWDCAGVDRSDRGAACRRRGGVSSDTFRRLGRFGCEPSTRVVAFEVQVRAGALRLAKPGERGPIQLFRAGSRVADRES